MFTGCFEFVLVVVLVLCLHCIIYMKLYRLCVGCCMFYVGALIVRMDDHKIYADMCVMQMVLHVTPPPQGFWP